MAIQKVGLIGLGAIGRPMCRRMTEAGYLVYGYDPDTRAVELAAELGLRPLANAGAVALECDFVIVVVGSEKQVEAVIFGPDGLLTGAQSGLMIGLGSTVSPSFAKEIASRLQGHDLGLLDMPVTRSDRAAETGTLLVLGGADPDVFTACKPVLQTFATDIFNLGKFGNGQIAKMVNNTILWACMTANDEGLRLGEQLGVDQDAMREALSVSSAANFAMIDRVDMYPIPWAEKDMIIAQQEADKLHISIPMTGLVKELTKAFKSRKGYATPLP